MLVLHLDVTCICRDMPSALSDRELFKVFQRKIMHRRRLKKYAKLWVPVICYNYKELCVFSQRDLPKKQIAKENRKIKHSLIKAPLQSTIILQNIFELLSNNYKQQK